MGENVESLRYKETFNGDFLMSPLTSPYNGDIKMSLLYGDILVSPYNGDIKMFPLNN